MSDECTIERHEAVKRDPKAWASLDFVAVQRLPADEDGPAEALELRNCACGSTLCVRIEASFRVPAEEGEAA